MVKRSRSEIEDNKDELMTEDQIEKNVSIIQEEQDTVYQ